MTALNDLRKRLQQDDYAFSETLAFVAEHYVKRRVRERLAA